MEMLYTTAWGGAGASLLSTMFFFAIQWILGTSQARRMQERIFLSRKDLSKAELDNIVAGVTLRIVGFVHNSLQVIFALTVMVDASMWEDAFHKQTPMSQFVAVVSAGFFLWDLIVCIAGVSKEPLAFIMHGLLCFLVYGYMVVSGNMHIYGCSFLMWEISTPFTQIRWLLSNLKLQHTTLFVVNGLTMMFAFFCCRIVWGTYLSYDLISRAWRYLADGQRDIPLVVLGGLVVANLSLNCLNCFWFSKMLKAAKKVFFPPKKKEAAKEG